MNANTKNSRRKFRADKNRFFLKILIALTTIDVFAALIAALFVINWFWTAINRLHVLHKTLDIGQS
jgi:hypothetical protein